MFPSAVEIHNLMDTIDNGFILVEKLLAEIPLENNSWFVDFGRYKLANSNTYQYFTKLNYMWNQDIYIIISEESSETEKSNDGNGDDD